MPPRIRELKAALSKAGFHSRTAKGSHTVWKHPALPDIRITLAGKDGKNAKDYQIDDVRDALKRLGGKL
jgi:predicted RNA binding protein YcfA (HicA-like mRNA interferase family)